MDTCPDCDGSGKQEYESLNGPMGISVEVTCRTCRGTGEVE